jgi:hypothetical protein
MAEIIVGDAPNADQLPEVNLPVWETELMPGSPVESAVPAATPQMIEEPIATDPLQVVDVPVRPEPQPVIDDEDEDDADSSWFYRGFKQSRQAIHDVPTSLASSMRGDGLEIDDIEVDDRGFYAGPPPPSDNPDAEPPITDDSLLEDDLWLFAASKTYEMMMGEPHPDLEAASLFGPRATVDRGARERLSDYAKVFAAGFNWNIKDLGVTTYHLAQSDQIEAAAAQYLLETYRKKGTTREDVYRSFNEVFTDPVSMALLFTSLGLGNLLGKGAAWSAQQGVKAYAKRALPHAVVGGAFGGPFTALHNAAQQYVDVRAGGRERIDPVELGVATGIGVVGGAVLTGVTGPAIEAGVGKLVSTAQAKMRQGKYDAAVRDLELAQKLRDAAREHSTPDPQLQLPSPDPRADRAAPVTSLLPGEISPDQIPLFPDQALTAAADLPGVPVAKLPEVAQDLDALGFYSAALRVAEELPQEKGPPGQMRKMLLSGAGVREEELVWTGLGDLLDQRAKQGKKARITKQEIIDHLRANRVVIWEIEGVKVEGAGREDVEVDTNTVPDTWDREVLDDPDYVNSMAEDLVDDINTYWDEIQHHLDDSVDVKALAKLSPDDLRENEDVIEAAQRMAQAQYEENPYYRMTDESGHGYEIVGNDDAEYAVRTPSGRRVDRRFDSLSDAKEWVVQDAFDHDLVEFIGSGDEFESEYVGYTMPGGTNYREILLTFDSPAGPYTGGHMQGDFAPGYVAERDRNVGTSRDLEELESDELTSPENVLAHVRVKDRVINGENVLSVEEIQSDWHKKRRKSGGGYEAPAYRKRGRRDQQAVFNDTANLLGLSEVGERDAAGESFDFFWLGPDRMEEKIKTTQLWRDVRDIVLDKSIATGQERADLLRELLKDMAYLRPLPRSSHLLMPTRFPPSLEETIDKYNVLAEEYQGGLKSEVGVPDAPYKSMDERGWPQLAMRRIMRYAVENDYDRIAWSPGQMQRERYGAPAKLYDKTIPKIMNKIIKKFDPSMKIDEDQAMYYGMYPMDTYDGERFFIPSVKLTSKMRASIKRLGQAIMALPPVVAAGAAMDDQRAEQPQ